jgi:hypothetical protein
VTRGVIRLALLAGVLLAAYLLVVKPIVRTADHAVHASGIEQIGRTLETVSVQVQREIRRSLKLAKSQGGNPQRLIHCIEHAHQDVERIERCTRRF